MTYSFISADEAKWLIDATIMYPNGEPLDVLCILLGLRDPCQVTVHYRKHLMADIPKDLEGLTKWLFDLYEQKDKMLAEYHKSGKLPAEDAAPKRPLYVDTLWIWFYSIVFISGSYIACSFAYSLIACVCHSVISLVV